MGRPATITDDEILAAARAVFLANGISATVEDVAARCHVGEATVFRRFPTKHALFLAAMDAGGELEWARTLPERARRTDVRTNLLELATEMLTFTRKMLPLVMMKLSNPCIGTRPGPPASVFRARSSLTQFFAAQIKYGLLRVSDPRVATRILFGAIQNFLMFEAFAHGDGLTDAHFLEQLVDMLCVPAPAARRRASHTRLTRDTK